MERRPREKHTQEKRQEQQIISMQRREELQGKLGKEKKKKTQLDVAITIVNLVRYINISGIWGKIICFFLAIPSNFFI